MTDQPIKLTPLKLCYWLSLASLFYGLGRNLWWDYDHGKLTVGPLVVRSVSYALFAWWMTAIYRGHKRAAWVWLVLAILVAPIWVMYGFFGESYVNAVVGVATSLPGAVLAIIVIRAKQTDTGQNTRQQ